MACHVGAGHVRWFGCTVMGTGAGVDVLQLFGAAGLSSGDELLASSHSRSAISSSSMMDMSRIDGRCDLLQPRIWYRSISFKFLKTGLSQLVDYWFWPH